MAFCLYSSPAAWVALLSPRPVDGAADRPVAAVDDVDDDEPAVELGLAEVAVAAGAVVAETPTPAGGGVNNSGSMDDVSGGSSRAS